MSDASRGAAEQELAWEPDGPTSRLPGLAVNRLAVVSSWSSAGCVCRRTAAGALLQACRRLAGGLICERRRR